MGSCEALQSLDISDNTFSALPCSFYNLKNLQLLVLEWFIYAAPSLPKELDA